MTYQVNKTIKNNTSLGASIIDDFNRAFDVSSIYDIYTNFSRAKYNAFESCKETYAACGGVGGLRCSGSSSFAFSVCFKDNNGNIYKITKDNFYKVVA